MFALGHVEPERLGQALAAVEEVGGKTKHGFQHAIQLRRADVSLAAWHLRFDHAVLQSLLDGALLLLKRLRLDEYRHRHDQAFGRLHQPEPGFVKLAFDVGHIEALRLGGALIDAELSFDTMATRYLVQHPRESRLSLMVDVVDLTDAAALAHLKRDMLGRGCWHGLLIDDENVVVLRDRFSEKEEDSIVEQARLPTAQLLPKNGSLERRVNDWLEHMSTNWRGSVPKEPWADVLLYGVVPALAGSEIHRLEPDAA